jgi:transcriptional regulator with XRE-family HTH domain
VTDESSIAVALGKRVKRLREGKRWSQEQLAAETGLHRSYIAGIESGKRNPSLRNIVRLAMALEVSLVILFQGNGAGVE